MATTHTTNIDHTNWHAAVTELADNLGSLFADRATTFDLDGTFVQQNYDDMKSAKFFSAAIPTEIGGGGLSYSELCGLCRQLAQYCGSTALAFAMHSHPVALNIFKFHKGDEKAKATLTKIAANELIIAGTGANDWLSSNGTATAIEGGIIVNAHKRFVSGCPGAQVLVSSVHHETSDGNEVIHFSIPFSTEGIRVQNNWNTLGMRATGSNDVILENVFIPNEAIAARRPAGVWHPLWDTVLPIAMPIIVSAYMGMAEAAMDIAIATAQGKEELTGLVGTMNNQMVIASMATNEMVRMNNNFQFTPSPNNSEAILARKTIATTAIKEAVDTAANIVGGAGFFKGHALERIIRDVRAMHFHPLPEHKQTQISGRLLLGLDLV